MMPQMKTIGIDCRFAGTNSGLGRYTRELVTHLVSLPSSAQYCLFVRDIHEEWLQALSAPVTIIQAPFPHYSLSEHFAFPRILKKAKIDLFFSPHFNIPYFCPVPCIVTIHDLILHRYPNNAPLIKRFFYVVLMKRSLQQSVRIITVSEFVRTEIDEVYHHQYSQKITVIPEAVSETFSHQSEAVQKKAFKRFGISSPYFLYVGNAKEHKNVQMLLNAFEKAALQDTELVLVMSGKEVRSLKVPTKVIVLSDVQDHELQALYSGAVCFVTASLYEGFGLPILEAEACHCPVIATRSSAMPEVGSDAVYFCEPTVEAFVQALQHPPRWRERVLPSWKNTAQTTLKVLQEIL